MIEYNKLEKVSEDNMLTFVRILNEFHNPPITDEVTSLHGYVYFISSLSAKQKGEDFGGCTLITAETQKTNHLARPQRKTKW